MKLSILLNYGICISIASCSFFTKVVKVVNDVQDNAPWINTKVREYEFTSWLKEKPDKEYPLKMEVPAKGIHELASKDIDEIGKVALQVVYTGQGNKLPIDCGEIHQSIVVCRRTFSDESYLVVAYRPLLFRKPLSGVGLRRVYHSLAQSTFGRLVEKLTSELKAKDRVILTGGAAAGLLAHYQGVRLIRKHPILGFQQDFSNKHGLVKIITFNSPPPFSVEAVEYFHQPNDQFLDFSTKEFPNDVNAPTAWLTWATLVPCPIVNLQSTYSPIFKSDSNLLNWFTSQHLEKLDPPLISDSKLVGDVKIETLTKTLTELQMSINEAIFSAGAAYNEIRQSLKDSSLGRCVESLEKTLRAAINAKYKESLEYVKMHSGRDKDNWALPGERLSCKGRIDEKGNLYADCSFQRISIIRFALKIENSKDVERQKIKALPSRRGSKKNLNIKGLQEDDIGLDNIESKPLYPKLNKMETKSNEDNDDSSALLDDSLEEISSEFTNKMELSSSPKSDLKDSLPNNNNNSDSSIVLHGSGIGLKWGDDGAYLITQENFKSFETCLKDLFQVFPELEALSPFSQQALKLHYVTEGQSIKRFQALAVPDSQPFFFMYLQHREIFLGLITGPGRKNPETCQTGILPILTVLNTSNDYTGEYWKKITQAKNLVITNFYGAKKEEQSPINDHLFKFISESMDPDPAKWHFDCTNPVNLWHSPTFCPWFCRIWSNSAFCKRVYVGTKGLKMSLRGGTKATSSVFVSNSFYDMSNQIRANVDYSYNDLKQLSEMNTRHDNSLTLGLHLEVEGKSYYLVVFLEGSVFEEFKKVANLK